MTNSYASHDITFICGLHRSGTSLLHELMADHPQISGFANTGVPEDEGLYLQQVYPKSRNLNEIGKFAFMPESVMNEKSRLITDDNRRKLFEQWSKHWDLKKKMLIEKSFPNVIRSRFLQGMFPQARFIFLVRHPVAVALATQKTVALGVPELVDHWQHAHRIALSDMDKLKHSLVVRYEDLIARPEIIMQGIYEFLELEKAPLKPVINDEINRQYYKQWEQIMGKDTKLRDTLKPFADIAAKFSYSFDAPYDKGMGR